MNPRVVQSDRPARTWARAVGLVALVGAVYADSLNGVFLFDDLYRIVENCAIRSLWPITPLLNNDRPVVEVTLALNYTLDGLKPRGYHIVNILIHAAAALTLAGVIRRTRQFVSNEETDASWLPWTIAALWALHPLQTQSVTYIIQRGESLMGFFYLLTLYCAIRRRTSPSPRVWLFASTLACAMGMASKAVMVTAPIAVWLHDLIFWPAGPPRRKLTQFAALASTWSILLSTGLLRTILDPAALNSGVGFSVTQVTPSSYLLTQAQVILHYLRLSLWPIGLCLDYDWPFVRSAMEVLPQLTLMGGGLCVAILGVIRRRWWGFAAAWFFLILAPTSSLIPIKDAIFEHRMYLPLAGVVAIVVLASTNLLNRLPVNVRVPTGAVVSAVVILVLGFATFQRNRDYASELGIWQDVARKRPTNARAHTAMGNAYLAQGMLEEALAAHRDAVRINPDLADGHAALGMALARKGDFAAAIGECETAIRLDPSHAKAYYNLGNSLTRLDRLDAAISAYRKAVEITPDFADAWCNLGNALVRLGRLPDAEQAYQQTLAVAPTHAMTWNNLGDLRRQQGRLEDALAAFRRAVEADPDYANAHANLAAAYLDANQPDHAMLHAKRALQLAPNHPTAARLLEEAARARSNP